MSVTPEEGPAYLPMPSSVAQYVPPLLPDDAELREATPVALRFLKEVLGSGEVSALVMGNPELQVEETIFAGLWRVRGDGVDYLEVGDVPEVLRQRAAAKPMALPDP